MNRFSRDIPTCRRAASAACLAVMFQLEAAAAEVPRSPGATIVAPEVPGADASDDVSWVRARADELLRGCQVTAADGTRIYTPDGKGNYRALWTRDFAYMVENAGDLLPVEATEACLRMLLRGVREDGAAPDRVRPDGVAVFVAGPEDRPIGEPNIDNAQFLVIAADEHARRVEPARRTTLLAEWLPVLVRAMDWIPRSETGLVWNDPAKPHSPYGFTDCIGKTGELLFESILYHEASRRLARRLEEAGKGADAARFAERAVRIEKGIGVLWDESEGAFRAATRDCRQLDVWGNAYAVWTGFPLGERRERILRFLVDRRDRYLFRGQIRHLLAGEHWGRLLLPVEKERYQNGAYWATASGWVIWAFAEKDPDLARRTFRDLVEDFRSGGICECVHPDGYRQLPSYVVSATNPLGAARRLGACLRASGK